MTPLIYIIDDNPADIELVRLAFAENGIAVRCAAFRDGIEALVQLETALPDLVLIDINMPLVEGFTVLEAMRAMPRLAGIPAIMMSSSRAEHDRQRALRCGAAQYWVKTHSFTDLVERVAALPGVLLPPARCAAG